MEKPCTGRSLSPITLFFLYAAFLLMAVVCRIGADLNLYFYP